mgnify:CR=1 FL=1
MKHHGIRNSRTAPIIYAGDDIEAFLKKELSNRTPTEELVSGETKPPTSGTVFDAMVGTVTDVDVQDSEDGTQYVMTVKQKDNQGGESSKEVRFSNTRTMTRWW